MQNILNRIGNWWGGNNRDPENETIGTRESPYIPICLGTTGGKVANWLGKYIDEEIVVFLTNVNDEKNIDQKLRVENGGNVHVRLIYDGGLGGRADEVPNDEVEMLVKKMGDYLKNIIPGKRLAFPIGSVSGSTFTLLCKLLCKELFKHYQILSFPFCSMPLKHSGEDEHSNVIYYISSVENSNDDGILTSTFFDPGECMLSPIPVVSIEDKRTNDVISRPITYLIKALRNAVIEENDIIKRFGRNKWASFYYMDLPASSEEDIEIQEIRHYKLLKGWLSGNTLAGVPASSQFAAVFSVPDEWKKIAVKENVLRAINEVNNGNVVKFGIEYGSDHYTHFIWSTIEIERIIKDEMARAGGST